MKIGKKMLATGLLTTASIVSLATPAQAALCSTPIPDVGRAC